MAQNGKQKERATGRWLFLFLYTITICLETFKVEQPVSLAFGKP